MLVGASVPAIFSAMLMLGVDRNAQRMVSLMAAGLNKIVAGCRTQAIKKRCQDLCPDTVFLDSVNPSLSIRFIKFFFQFPVFWRL